MLYRREIDGLRAVAVIPVVLFHAGISAFSGGFVGVDIFFVISGYLITGIIAADIQAGRFSILDFYERRARRILPALGFVVAACVPIAYLWLTPRELAEFGQSAVATALFASNIFFWSKSDYFATAAELKPLLHTWSLAVEEQFYIFFPLLLLALRRARTSVVVVSLVAIGVISLALAQWAAHAKPTAAFFLIPFRTWELLVGSVVAYYHLRGYVEHRKWVSELGGVLGLVAIASAIVLFDKETPFPGAFALVPTAGTALVILFASPATVVGRLLGRQALVSVGLISYSVYLWHQPLFAFARHRWGDGRPMFVALIALSVILGYLTWRFVERPFRGKLRAARDRRTFYKLAGSLPAMALVGLLVGYVATEHRAAVPAYKEARTALGDEFMGYLERRDVVMPCGDRSAAFQTCEFGATGSATSAVLWGDSLAGALLHGFDSEMKRSGRHAVAFISNGCPPLLGIKNVNLAGCTEETHEEILRRIEQMPGAQTVFVIGNLAAVSDRNIRLGDRPARIADVGERVALARNRLHKAGKRIVVIEQGPFLPDDASLHYLAQLHRSEAIELELPRERHLARVVPLRVARGSADAYVETADFFCPTSTCPARDAQGRLIIYDKSHVTREYSAKLAAFVLERASGF